MLSGRRYYVYAPTRAECRQKLLALLERHRRGQLTPPQRLTLQDFAERWLEGCRGRVRPKTLQTYQDAMRALLPVLGKMRLDRLSSWHVHEALERLRRDGRGTRFLQLAYGALSACLGEAVRLGLLGANPVTQAPRPRHERQEGGDWSLQDMKNFLRTCMEDTRPLAILLGFLLLTGLRPGEALGLRWEDVDLRSATLAVKRNLIWAGSTWHIGKPKTKAGERVVALPASAVALLRRLPRNSVHLFWAEKPPSTKQLSQAMRGLCEKAGVPPKPVRFLRRAHVSSLVASGADLKSLQKRMGHSHVSTTLNIYAYPITEMDKKVAELVDRALGA
ncbi:MAG: site-specific integrase [Dehalococcoidia bacterium]|nr:site-specific integrase [Dehalococcoidia bacterium]